MFYLQCNDISYAYPGSHRMILDHVSLSVGGCERHALIGANGCGKTTLLRIILQDIQDYEGELKLPRQSPVIGYLPQNFQINHDITVTDACHKSYLKIAEGTEGEWQADREIERVLYRCGLSGYSRQTGSSLSGGEKTRLALACLLIQSPDLLILDEPTNHLDLDMMRWLEGFVREFEGALLYVSHDREFIDRTATHITELIRGQAVTRAGNYTGYRRQQREEAAHQQVVFDERRKLIGRLTEASQKRRQWAQSFQRQTGAEGGGYVYESVYNAARTMMQQAKHIEQRINMLEERYPVEKPWREKQREINFVSAGNSAVCVLTITDLIFSWGERRLFEGLSLELHRGERMLLSGSNGCGKTTLLRLISGSLLAQSGMILLGSRVKTGFYSQEFEQLPPTETVTAYLESIRCGELAPQTVMGCLGADREVFGHRIGELSEGEKAKTALAALLLGNANLLLLDEPTNHLDIPAREMLENALTNFPGTVLFVSHDRGFMERVATRELRLGHLNDRENGVC